MEIFITIFMFIIGAIFGSFYNVVGLRLPKGESIVTPPSHCPNCKHKLSALELIPIISYFIQGGKCRHCGEKISYIYPIFEAICGLFFALAYVSFGLSPMLLIALTFISMMIIIVVSDFNYLIINDSVLLTFGSLLAIETFAVKGFENMLIALGNGVLAFILMFALKKFGDFLFKKESMGGGDIKLMFIIGMTLSFPVSVVSIFLASLIGLPISLIYLNKSSSHIIPFGPFLALASIILLLTQIDFNSILNFYG